MVALLEDLEVKSAEDRARSLGHSPVVARVAPSAEREVHGLGERAQLVEVEAR